MFELFEMFFWMFRKELYAFFGYIERNYVCYCWIKLVMFVIFIETGWIMNNVNEKRIFPLVKNFFYSRRVKQ